MTVESKIETDESVKKGTEGNKTKIASATGGKMFLFNIGEWRALTYRCLDHRFRSSLNFGSAATISGEKKMRKHVYKKMMFHILQLQFSKFHLRETFPVGIWCQNDVVSTSMRRNHVASTLIRRHFTSCVPAGFI